MPLGKVFAALARERPWTSLRSQGEAGWGLPRGVACPCAGSRGGGAVSLAGCGRLRRAAECSSGRRAVRGGHAREAPGALRDVVACLPWRVEASAFVAPLCPVAGWEGCSATTLIVSSGGWPMRLSLPSTSGEGVLVRQHIKKTCQCACSEAEARRVYWLEFIAFNGCGTGYVTGSSS